MRAGQPNKTFTKTHNLNKIESEMKLRPQTAEYRGYFSEIPQTDIDIIYERKGSVRPMSGRSLVPK
jgi:hypothetical protein